MTKHIHIHFSPRKPTKDQASGSVPGHNVKPLVEALLEAIAAREGTKDAGFDESKIKRDADGRFASKAGAGTETHAAMLKKGDHLFDSSGKKVDEVDHVKPTGKGEYQVGTASGQKHQTSEEHLPAGLHAKHGHETKSEGFGASGKAPGSSNTLASPGAEFQQGSTVTSPGLRNPGSVFGSAMAAAKPPRFTPEQLAQMQAIQDKHKAILDNLSPAQREALRPHMPGDQPTPPPAQQPAPQASQQPGAKPTSAKAKGAKAATHELLSSGHPFTMDDLVAATGASKANIQTALADLKNPKYAGKLGQLDIVKDAQGNYRVVKKAEESGNSTFGHMPSHPGERGIPVNSAHNIQARIDQKAISHQQGTGQTFLPTQAKTSAGSVTKTGYGFKAKNPDGIAREFKTHEEERAKAYAAGQSEGSQGMSMAQIAQGLIDRGIVKPGSTTQAPGTAPKLTATGLQSSKADAVNKPAKPLKHTPLEKPYGVDRPGQYTSTPRTPRSADHVLGKKNDFRSESGMSDNVVPARSFDIHHNGEHIGQVHSYTGSKDGPKINAAGVVAWRKPAVQFGYELNEGHKRPPNYNTSPASTMGFSSAKEAMRQLIRSHAPQGKAPGK